MYAADAGAYTQLQGKPYSTRLPLFHQLDLRVDKRWQFRTWRFSMYLDVQNVYNNAAVERAQLQLQLQQAVLPDRYPDHPEHRRER